METKLPKDGTGKMGENTNHFCQDGVCFMVHLPSGKSYLYDMSGRRASLIFSSGIV